MGGWVGGREVVREGWREAEQAEISDIYKLEL